MIKSKQKSKRSILLTGCFLFGIVLLYLLFGTGRIKKWQDLHRLSKDSYSGAFLATYDIEAYHEDDFVNYRGITVVKTQYTLRTWRDLSRYLTEIFSSENTITNVYLGLDPEILWEESGKNEENWAKNYDQYLAPYLEARPDVEFEFLLPTPSLKYWVNLSSEQMEENLAVFGRLVADLGAYTNTTAYFMGGEQWLIANPGNYQDDLRTTSHVSQKIFLYTFCDHEYQIVSTNAGILFDGLRMLVSQEKESPAVYPDLSEWCMVFFGDSVLEYNAGSYSLPGVVEGFTGAQVYNCGQGGISAAENANSKLSLNRMVNRFLQLDDSDLEGMDNYVKGLNKYRQEKHTGKKYCFVLNFGLNDYFSAHPVDNPKDAYDAETYAGALRSGIRTLKEAYPDAQILLLAPTYTALFSGGTEILGKQGSVLKDYVDAATLVASETDVIYINNYEDSGIGADTWWEYLADGTHPNERGALLLGGHIMDEMAKVIAKE